MEPSITDLLRKKALETSANEFQIVPPTEGNGVWGVIMDRTTESGSYSAVALLDGNASIYCSSESSVIGGYSHESVRRAAIAAVSIASSIALWCQPAPSLPLPRPGYVRFQLRARTRLLASPEIEEFRLVNHAHPLANLFFAMHKVITELHRMAQGGNLEPERLAQDLML